MTTEWAVTTGTERIALDSAGAAEVIFTVTNRATVNDRAVLDIVVEPPTDRSWFTIEEPQRLITASASVPYRVKVAVPPGAQTGTHFFKALVYSADSAPEENARYSNRVAFEVKAAEQPKKPSWIPILIGAGVLLVVVLVVVGFLVFRSSPSESPTDGAPPTGPDVTDLDVASVRSDVVAPGQQAEAVANCPAGTAPLGGGHLLRSSVGMVIDISQPSNQGWRVHGFNPGATNVDFDIEVVCGIVRDRQVVNASVSVAAGQVGTAVANCPAGKVSVGGGGAAVGLVIDTSRPAASGQGWQVRAINNTGVARIVAAQAVCAVAPSRTVATTSFTAQPNAISESVVPCPDGTVATGGGFVFNPTTGLSLFLSTPSSTKGWDVRADNRSNATRNVTAFAVCVSEG